MSSRRDRKDAEFAQLMANMQTMKNNLGIPSTPVGSPPLAPPVPTSPTTPSGEKGAETTDGGGSNTMLYVGIGIGVVILIVVSYFIFRK